MHLSNASDRSAPVVASAVAPAAAPVAAARLDLQLAAVPLSNFRETNGRAGLASGLLAVAQAASGEGVATPPRGAPSEGHAR